MKPILKSQILTFIFCFLLLFFSFKVFAQEVITLGVSPPIFELDVFLGEEISKEIKVTNKSDVPVPILARVLDFTAEDETGEMIFEEGTEDSSRFWFEIENPNFILNPKESRRVNFKISVPRDAQIGGYYSVFLFEPQLPSFYFREGEPKAIPVVGVLFMLSVQTLSPEFLNREKLEIVEFSLPKEERLVGLENFLSRLTAGVVQAAEFTVIEKSPSKFTLKIKNNDIYHLKPAGKVLIYNFFGKKVGETGVEKKTILPGKIRIFPVNFSPQIPSQFNWLPASISKLLVENTFFGRYKAVLAIEAKDAQIENTIIFWVFSWKLILIILLLGLTLFFGIIKRKKIKLALKVLVRGKDL